jgi:hypothetical protein
VLSGEATNTNFIVFGVTQPPWTYNLQHLMQFLYPPRNEVVGGYTGFTMSVRLSVRPSVRPSVCPSVCRQILCRTITWVVLLRIFNILSSVYWWREEDPFLFWRFSLLPFQSIGLDMTENRIFTLCRMITWVVFLRMFWNFISSLPVKRGGSL